MLTLLIISFSLSVRAWMVSFPTVPHSIPGVDLMPSSSLESQIEALLTQIEAESPVIYDLGTPQIVETQTVRDLLALGQPIVPYLLDQLQTASPKVTAYLVFVLGRLGDSSTLAPLQTVRTRYKNIPNKTDWEYAVIGQCNIAIDNLEPVNPSP
jgi:hypothetical protein